MNHITKTFPGVKALDDVSFNLKSGEVLALLGENGAGKSTLMKVLSGVYSRDGGELSVFGEHVERMTPKRAKELGIAIIHQELNLCAHLTVAENIFLGQEIAKGGVVQRKQMNQRARELLGRLSLDIEPETLVGSLSVSKQQMIEIAKALLSNARVLIMDEPTSALTAKEINELFRIIKQLRSEGCGIVYISHRLEELQHIVDRVTIMRDGQFVTSMNFQDTTLDHIISNMVGRDIQEKFPRVETLVGETVLEVRNLNAGRMVRNVSFSVRAGEIVGIAGLMGAGRTETTRAIFGVDPKDSGEILLDGKPIRINSPRDAIRQGVVLAPEDRKKDGLCTKLSVRHNIALPNLDLISSKLLQVVSTSKEGQMVADATKNFQIKMANAEVDAASLSGGNQQKVVVSKWLARNSRIVIFDEPTRGIDVAAKVEIYRIMNQLKARGIAVLFVSSEMPEILGMSDRILVMCDGRVTGEIDIRDATQEKIMRYATQFENKLAQ
ncbi:MAG: sugar ABC transporter ATP-binding protein [Oscillospiraceae bacterium]|nr:sugar ABC transporter ATP-binding protein [Oscillospiraceae bacterium]